MKVYGFSLVFILAAMAMSGCAKDNLDSLHLVSREEISVQKRQASGTAESTSVDQAAAPAETAVPAETAEAKTPAAQ